MYHQEAVRLFVNHRMQESKISGGVRMRLVYADAQPGSSCWKTELVEVQVKATSRGRAPVADVTHTSFVLDHHNPGQTSTAKTVDPETGAAYSSILNGMDL